LTEKVVEILIVEDNAGEVELILDALRQSGGGRVLVVSDGAEALDFLFRTGAYAGRPPREEPSLVLLDLKLPKVSGLDVLERVKSDPETRPIPVVVLTSSRERGDIEAAYRLQANSYVVKPADFEEFGKTLRQIQSYWLELNQPCLS